VAQHRIDRKVPFVHSTVVQRHVVLEMWVWGGIYKPGAYSHSIVCIALRIFKLFFVFFRQVVGTKLAPPCSATVKSGYLTHWDGRMQVNQSVIPNILPGMCHAKQAFPEVPPGTAPYRLVSVRRAVEKNWHAALVRHSPS
jgi:hypothetical protein